jgi:hypothetical protein
MKKMNRCRTRCTRENIDAEVMPVPNTHTKMAMKRTQNENTTGIHPKTAL